MLCVDKINNNTMQHDFPRFVRKPGGMFIYVIIKYGFPLKMKMDLFLFFCDRLTR